MAQPGQDASDASLRDPDRWPPELATMEDILAQPPSVTLPEARQLPMQMPGERSPQGAPRSEEKKQQDEKQNPDADLAMEHLRFMELCRLHSTSVTLNEGDTLVIIDYPAHPKHVDCYGTPYHSQEFRVHSHRLLAAGSSRFAEMLSPEHQIWARKRKKFVGRVLPEGVEYVLDLTPPSEGDDLAFQMARLSLTPGVVDWWACGGPEGEGADADAAWMINGHDDVCTCKKQTPIAEALRKSRDEEKEREEKLAHDEAMEQGAVDVGPMVPAPANSETPDQASRETGAEEHPEDHDSKEAVKKTQNSLFRQIPDYCPIRHRNSIIRLLMLIQGWDIMLDSANRVWSMAAIASIWDCPSVVSNQVNQWIVYDENIKFIEVLPEEALRIGFDLRLVQITQCAFRILANELAIELAATPSSPPTSTSASTPTPTVDDPLLQQRRRSRTTMFGRKLGHLDDELSNMVQHAARALIERMSTLLVKFENPTMLSIWTGKEWTNLKKMEQVLAQEDDHDCVSALACLRRFMDAMTCPMANHFTSVLRQIPARGTPASERLYAVLDRDRATYVPLFKGLDQIMKTFNTVQKFMCPFIYEEFVMGWCARRERRPFSRSNPDDILTVTLAAEFKLHIQRFVIKNPRRATSEAWDVFFEKVLPRHRTAFELKHHLIDMEALDLEFEVLLKPITSSRYRPVGDFAAGIARHLLLTLNSEEMKFLPLWADGLDDGTGGVFEDPRPPAQLGPDGPGPAYRTGMTEHSASSTSDLASLRDGTYNMRISGSTVVGSMDAQDSISTLYGRRHVIPGSGYAPSESFTTGGSEFLEVAAENKNANFQVGMAMDEYRDDESESTITDIGSVVDVDEEMSETDDGEAEGVFVVHEQSDGEDSVVLV